MRRKSAQTHWEIRPDHPYFASEQHSRLVDLSNNAIYRWLIFYDRRQRWSRRLMVFGTAPALFVAAWVYLELVWAVGRGHAVAGALAMSLMVAILLANIFVLAGIEGYETNGNLRDRFFDIITTGIRGDEIARAIWGKTLSGWRPGLIRTALLAAALVLVFLVSFYAFGGRTGMLAWMLLLGVWACFHLYMIFYYLPWVTLPGTLLWYRGVRKSYERRLRAQEGRPEPALIGVARTFVFLFASIGGVFAPIFLYALAGQAFFLGPGGRFPVWLHPNELWLLCVGYAAAGLLTGWLWGAWAKRTAPRRFERLAGELERLFQVRGWVLFGG